MAYSRLLPSGITIASMRAEHAEPLEALQKIVFPTLHASELMWAKHYRKHLEFFPEGQLVALDGDRPVGATSTLRLNFDFDHIQHTFAELLAEGWMTTHQPGGKWLYGMDVSVHPDYRRRGIARGFYTARHELVHQLGLSGQIAGAMPIGYKDYKDQMPFDVYFEKVRGGEITDPTVTAQMRIGFELVGILENYYLDEPLTANHGVLIRLRADQEVLGA